MSGISGGVKGQVLRLSHTYAIYGYLCDQTTNEQRLSFERTQAEVEA